MSKFGVSKPVTTHAAVHAETVAHQHVPGRAFDVSNPTLRLIHTIGGGFFNEPKYYDSNRSAAEFYSELLTTGKISSTIKDAMGLTEQASEILATASEIAQGLNGANPEDLLIIAAWARDPEKGLKLRTTPQILLALAASFPKTKPFVKRYATSIIRRPDELAEVFGTFRHLFSKKEAGRNKGGLPHSLRKGLVAAFEQFSTYSLLKYAGGSTRPNLVDVLKMVSGSRKVPKKAGQANWPLPKAVFEYLVNGKVTEDAPEIIKLREQFFALKTLTEVTPELLEKAGLTWENVTSKFGTSKEVWELCIPIMGEMALTRNLRNFEQVGISKTAWDKIYSVLGSVADTRQLPFRFFTAYRETTSTEAKGIVAQQLDNSCKNVPDLPGVTVVLTDNSGSAVGCVVSGKSNLRISDCGNTLAAIVAKRFGRNAIVGAFGDRFVWVNFNAADSCVTIKQAIDEKARDVGGSTETGLWFAIDDLTKRKVHVDRIVLLSDLCCYTQGDVNCGVNMNTHFGKDGEKATVQSMLDRYRRAVNPNLRCYSVNLSGHEQSQLRTTGQNTLMSGWSEQIFGLMRGVETLEERKTEAEIPAMEVLRGSYRRQ